jgi:bacteriocin-like protein
MEEPMRKTKKQKRPKSTDTLLKTSKKKDIELTEKELDKVSGGLGDIKGEQLEKDHKDWVRII